MKTIHQCAVCGGSIARNGAPGFPCSGICDTWYHAGCTNPPVIQRKEIDALLIGSMHWMCPICVDRSTSQSSNNTSAADSAGVMDLSVILGRLGRLEALYEASLEENSRLRKLLADLDGLRPRMRALELQMDARNSFWTMTSARASMGEAKAALVSRRDDYLTTDMHLPVSSSPLGRAVPRTHTDLMGSIALSPVNPAAGRGTVPRASKRVQINPVPTGEMTGSGSEEGAVGGVAAISDSAVKSAGAGSIDAADKRNSKNAAASDGASGQTELCWKPLTRCSSAAAADFVADPGVKLRWAFVTGFRPLTESAQLLQFVDSTLGQRIDARCFKLTPSNKPRASFRLGLPLDVYDDVISSSFWPNGILIKDYQFLPKRGSIAPSVPPLDRNALSSNAHEPPKAMRGAMIPKDPITGAWLLNKSQRVSLLESE